MASTSSSLVIQDDVVKIREAMQQTQNYITLPWMTKYEFDQLIGLRTMHLAKGALPMVPVPEGFQVESNMELRKIAIDELRQKRLPYMIKRPLPNGRMEYWPVASLALSAVEYLM
jgi:DNA-directed RNA polymerases I, II, and III subunit RPABC2